MVDPVLEPFLGSPVESAQEHDALRQLIENVTPVIEGVLRGKLSGQDAATEREELFSEAVLQLIRRLQDAKSDPRREAIANFNGYAAVTTFNVVHAHFRRVHPERQRLRNRIRHVARTSPRYGLWESHSGRSVCGLRTWAASASASESSEAELDRVPPLGSAESLNWNDAITRSQITRTLDHLFDHVRKPVDLERLVEKIAELLRLPVLSPAAVPGERADSSPSIESSLVYRSALEEVWREIGLLPLRQRVALLLSLRDGNGSPITSLLILLQITTFDGLAESVGLTPEQLAAIWDQLPLPDTAIAERLALMRQQVINLRKSARERLGRRLPFLRDGNPLLDRASS
jgi:DNA-directed RNA polymerase specialized sigma24 family protein